ncbi:hypothetical protein BC351_20490 [Paenibacillus ferrarius]|uniref:Uncharacterized protein n=1 Tax=Paenibacillus ferrarius TaxID=1469647 RepID=A0A1V4HN95_9BACL|nr:hypothetical protein BC351_20490 [Paenibacillus ferrarius]
MAAEGSSLKVVQAGSLPQVGIFCEIPANMHPFRPENKRNGEKPAIMHPLETFSPFQDGKA